MNKTEPTGDDVEGFLAVNAGDRIADCRVLIALMQEVTGEAARMWGPSIVGFGSYHYVYASGREGDSCLVGFAPRRAELSIYLTGIYFSDTKAKAEALLARLGKHRIGKACLYVKRLADIDLQVLRELIAFSVMELRARYG